MEKRFGMKKRKKRNQKKISRPTRNNLIAVESHKNEGVKRKAAKNRRKKTSLTSIRKRSNQSEPGEQGECQLRAFNDSRGPEEQGECHGEDKNVPEEKRGPEEQGQCHARARKYKTDKRFYNIDEKQRKEALERKKKELMEKKKLKRKAESQLEKKRV